MHDIYRSYTRGIYKTLYDTYMSVDMHVKNNWHIQHICCHVCWHAACPTAQRPSALPALSILSVAELVLLSWPTRVAKCYPSGPSGASFNSDKVFCSSKFYCGSSRGYLTWYFTFISPKGDWVKKSAKSVHKQKSLVFDPFRINKTQDFSDAPSK